jgi:hypothetical protein
LFAAITSSLPPISHRYFTVSRCPLKHASIRQVRPCCQRSQSDHKQAPALTLLHDKCHICCQATQARSSRQYHRGHVCVCLRVCVCVYGVRDQCSSQLSSINTNKASYVDIHQHPRVPCNTLFTPVIHFSECMHKFVMHTCAHIACYMHVRAGCQQLAQAHSSYFFTCEYARMHVCNICICAFVKHVNLGHAKHLIMQSHNPYCCMTVHE